jgi:hypothetical protein
MDFGKCKGKYKDQSKKALANQMIFISVNIQNERVIN